MTTIIAILLLTLVVIVCIVRIRRRPVTDAERSVELLRQARLMFPGHTDIEALDLLHEHVYRMMLARKKLQQKVDALVRDALLIHKERNDAIRRSIEFESRFIVPIQRRKSWQH
jgi:hypothetical protein